MAEDDDNDLDQEEDEEATTTIKANNALTSNLNAASLLLDEWKWRHQHCWNSLRRFILATVAVAVAPFIPYAGTEINPPLGRGILLFPLVAWIIALVGVWLYASEYTICRPVETMYHRTLGYFSPREVSYQHTKPGWQSIGQISILIYVVGISLLIIGDAWVITKVAPSKLPPDAVSYLFFSGLTDETRLLIASIWLLISVIYGFILSLWAGKKVREITGEQIERYKIQSHNIEGTKVISETPATLKKKAVAEPTKATGDGKKP